MNKIDKFINIENNKDILKVGLKDKNNNPILDEKGEVIFWTFDLADIELPLKYNKCEYEHKNNVNTVRMKFIAIDKKQDKKGKFLLSANDEEKSKALIEFYKTEERTLNLFLGEDGVKKFLNGRNYYWDMFDDIGKAVEPILPLFKNTMDNITDRIKGKYKAPKEENVLE